jgi:hypothetical protein
LPEGFVHVPEDENSCTFVPEAADVQVVPLDVSTLPEVPGATKAGVDVPLPKMTLLAVRVVSPVPPLATATVPVTLAAVPVVFWFKVGTSAAWIVAITTFVPLPRRYEPLVTAPANVFIAACAVVAPEPPLATGKAVPLRAIASVPEVVIGEPVTDKNEGTVAATEVTVPPPPPEPLAAAVIRP